MSPQTLGLFVLLSVVAFVEPQTPQDPAVTTYNGYSTPNYNVLEKTTSYELREYPPTNWVVSSSPGKNDNGLFWRLYGYITGENDEKRNIPMTVPVAIKIQQGRYTMSFYLPSSQNPEPTNPEVSLVSMPTFKVYVRRFGGYMNDRKRDYNLQMLKNDLKQGSYDTRYFFACGYDSPWRFWFRRNEVWLVAK